MDQSEVFAEQLQQAIDEEVEPLTEETEPWSPNKALVLFAHGSGIAIDYQANDAIKEWLSDAGARTTYGFDLASVAHERQPDGVYVGDLSLEDDGRGHYPDTSEVAVALRNLRPVTAEEWAAHREDEWPWPQEPTTLLVTGQSCSGAEDWEER